MWSMGALSGLLAVTAAFTLTQPDPPGHPEVCSIASAQTAATAGSARTGSATAGSVTAGSVLSEADGVRVRLRVQAIGDDVQAVIELSRDGGITWKPHSITPRADGGFETGWL